MTKSNSVKKAQLEFDLLAEDAVVKEFESEILALVDKFGLSGQSGGSAPFVSRMISNVVEKLCMQQPIGPITGDESEWCLDVFENQKTGKSVDQNKRCTSIFREHVDGVHKHYYNEAIIFQDEQESAFTGRVGRYSSSLKINFPFNPKSHYVDVIKVEVTEDDDLDKLTYYENDDGSKYYYKVANIQQIKTAVAYCLDTEVK